MASSNTTQEEESVMEAATGKKEVQVSAMTSSTVGSRPV